MPDRDPNTHVKQSQKRERSNAFRHFIEWLQTRVVATLVGRILTIVGTLFVIGLISLYWRVEPKRRQVVHPGPVPSPPPRPVVLAVFPNPATSSPSRPMLEGLGLDGADDLVDLSDGFVLERLYEVPDDPPKTAMLVAGRLKRGDVVLVLGHERSTMVEYLNREVYENEEWGRDTPIPLILPAATNPNLTATSGTRRHTLRLPDTDDRQVEMLSSAITKLRPRNVGIIYDTSNLTYSSYIGKQLVAHIDAVDQTVGVSLTDKGMPGEILKRDVVVVAGMEDLSKVLLRYAHHNATKRPLFFFTDGVAGPVFETAVNTTLEDKEAVWMSGPFPTDRLRGASLPSFPNYAPYAALAKGVAVGLLKETKTRFGVVTRQNVLRTLWTWLGDGQTRTFGLMSVSFNNRGDNVLGQTHMFEMRKGLTFHARMCVCGLPEAEMEGLGRTSYVAAAGDPRDRRQSIAEWLRERTIVRR